MTLAWTRWNPGYQEGAIASVVVAARKGWFEGYAWIIRANADVRFEDASFLEAAMRTSTAVLERCCPRDNERLQAHDAICTDFFAARPRAMNHSAWLAGPRLHGRVHNEWAAALVFRDAIDRGRATVWDVAEAYRSPACRVGGRGVFHDHAYCGEIAAPAPVPVRREAGAVVVVASAVVLLAAWAFVRLRCATRARRRH